MALDSGDIIDGSIISHYRIIKKLGSGGMGEVFQAHDILLDRIVALKILPSWLNDDQSRRQLLINEARAAAKLNHPNIISIYSVEEHEKRLFIVLEYLDGKTLKQEIDSRKLEPNEINDIAIQISKGLKSAHENGIIHGDIKSSNIIINRDGLVKITDFGLARIKDKGELAQKGSTTGTTAYMAPETIQDGTISQSTDMFSFGVVLYEITTGHLPFEGDYEASIIYSIVNDDPRPLNYYRSDTPHELRAIITKLLQKKPEERYQNDASLIFDIEKLTCEKSDAPRLFENKKAILAALTTFFIFIILGSIYYYRNRDNSESVTPQKMIVVLPFENLGNSDQDYFADGITDEITTQLTKIRELGVISRTSAIQYKGTKKNLKQIASELNVQYALEGTILWDKSGDTDRVRINPQLIRVVDDTHLWADTYQRSMANIFIIQSEIAENVVAELDIELMEHEKRSLESAPTQNLKAYDYYLKGNYYFGRSWREQDYRIAIKMYQMAIELDPNFALAYAMLSRANSEMYWEYYDRSDERLKMANNAVEKAMQIDSSLLDAHLALGMYYYSKMQFEPAMEQFLIVHKIRPDDSNILGSLAGGQRHLGKFQESAISYALAFKYDPRSQLRAFDVGLTYGLMRDYSMADSFMNIAISLAPDWPLPYIYRAWIQVFWHGDKTMANSILNSASKIADLSQTEYYEFYWWLARVLDNDPRKTLLRISMGSDSMTYYLYKAQLYNVMNLPSTGIAYYDSARVLLENRIAVLPDDGRFHSQLALAYAGMGRKVDAIREGELATRLVPVSKDAYESQFLIVNLAEIYLMTGDHDAAIEQLKILLSIPGYISAPYLKLDPIWSPLAEHPEFRKLIE